MTLDEYIEQDFQNRNGVGGFTIGKGKKVYWYFTPMPRSGLYRVLPIEDDGTLGRPRWIPGDAEITVRMMEI